MKFQMKFSFSNSSATVLINSLSNLRNEHNPTKRMNLSIGASIQEVDFNIILDLIRISYNRINLNLEEVDIVEMINRHQPTLDALRQPQKEIEGNYGRKIYSKENETLIQEIARLGQSFVVDRMMEIEGAFLDFKPTLFEIAQEEDDYELIKLVMDK